MHWIFYLMLMVVILAGLFMAAVNFPGLWVMVIGAALYAWVTHGSYLGLWWLGALLILAIIAELIDMLAAGAGAKRAGGSRRGMVGAIVGGLIGGFALSFLIPIPLLGTIIGICLGTFLGAVAGETFGGARVDHSVRIGVGATKGRLLGMLTKTLFGVVMFFLIAWAALPINGAAARAPGSRSVSPATFPAGTFPSITRGS